MFYLNNAISTDCLLQSYLTPIWPSRNPKLTRQLLRAFVMFDPLGRDVCQSAMPRRLHPPRSRPLSRGAAVRRKARNSLRRRLGPHSRQPFDASIGVKLTRQVSRNIAAPTDSVRFDSADLPSLVPTVLRPAERSLCTSPWNFLIKHDCLLTSCRSVKLCALPKQVLPSSCVTRTQPGPALCLARYINSDRTETFSEIYFPSCLYFLELPSGFPHRGFTPTAVYDHRLRLRRAASAVPCGRSRLNLLQIGRTHLPPGRTSPIEVNSRLLTKSLCYVPGLALVEASIGLEFVPETSPADNFLLPGTVCQMHVSLSRTDFISNAMAPYRSRWHKSRTLRLRLVTHFYRSVNSQPFASRYGFRGRLRLPIT